MLGLTYSSLAGASPAKLQYVKPGNTFTYPNTTASAGATGTITATLNVKSRGSQFKPHFVLIMGHFNDSVKATFTDNIATINTYLVAAGIVPIWVIEQNGDLATPTVDHSTGIYAAYLSAIQTEQATNDIGLVDMREASGGDTVDPTWVDDNATAAHPTFYPAQREYGKAIAAEVNRLLRSPPSYAWWA